MTDVPGLIRGAEAHLVSRGVPNARRNAEWLLAHVLGCRSPDLYLAPYKVIDREVRDAFQDLVRRRGEREPLQYILGTTEFMSLSFITRPGVFIPRPDTEILVEKVEVLVNAAWPPEERPKALLDLCCGSGVIGISLVCRLGRFNGVAVDVDEGAVLLSQENAAGNNITDRMQVVLADAGDFLRETTERFDVLVCNPPYIRSGDMAGLPPEVRDHEPGRSLEAGSEGLDFYQTVTPLIPRVLAPGAVVAFEIGDTQGAAVEAILADSSFEEIEIHRDYKGLDRVVTARRV
jgi:release factor glutamine methyltransferase